MKSLDLIYIYDIDDYGLLLDKLSNGKYFAMANEIVELDRSDFCVVDEHFRELYTGYKGLGMGDKFGHIREGILEARKIQGRGPSTLPA